MDIVLWRPRKDSTGKVIDAIVRRCPLFDEYLHSSPARTLAIDELHVLFIGPAQRYVSASLWRIILKNPWSIRGSSDRVADIGARYLKSELDIWQADPDNGVPMNKRLNNLTRGML
eukprot:3665631-Pyramimonas_sp.AAC.1